MKNAVHAPDDISNIANGQEHICKQTNLTGLGIRSFMDERQKEAQLFIDRAMAATGKDLTGLAKMAGLTPSTLTRFYNKPVKHTLSYRTLSAISGCSGIPIPGALNPTGLDEDMLALCIRAVDDVAGAEGLKLSLHERSSVIARLYSGAVSNPQNNIEGQVLGVIARYLSNTRVQS